MSSDSGSDEYPRAPAQKARDENILAIFEGTDDPVLTTSEVASELPIGKRATLDRLEALVEREELASKDVGVGRVWWRATEPDPEPTPEPVPDGVAPGAAVRRAPAEDDPRWSFVGSLGRHSIYAGIFVFGILMAESVTPQRLVPIPVSRLFLTAFVFFLIGFPARGLYRLKQFLDTRGVSPPAVLEPVLADDEPP
ncbi:MAG: hypothetical protein ABEJ30_07585 [Halorientalis sp.]